MKTDEEYLREAEREIEVMLNGLPRPGAVIPATSKVTKFISEHDAVTRAIGPILRERGYDPAFEWCREPFERGVTYTHIQSGFTKKYNEAYSMMINVDRRDHPALQFVRDLLAYLGRHVTEARGVYHDPHIVVL